MTDDRPVTRAEAGRPAGEGVAYPTVRQITAVVVGNALEFYDFLSFTFFAVNLARVMFPAGAPGTALLLMLLTGSLGFFARPVGAVIFGLLGDRWGRRPTMLLTFTLMGLGALGLALTPSYATIGIAAPMLVVFFRVMQGIGAGGDVGPTTAFLAESGSPLHRGFLTSLQLAAMRLGATASGLVGLGLAWAMSPAMLDSLGWRLAFGLGAAIVPFALLLRRRLEETLHLPEPDPHAPARVDPLLYAAALLGVFGGLSMSGIADFMFTFATIWLQVPARTAYWVTVAMGVTQVVTVITFGLLGDRFGRRPLKIAIALIGLALAWPLWVWLAAGPDIGRLILVVVTSSFLSAAIMALAYATLVEVTPKHARSGLVGIGYGLVVAAAFGIGPPLLAGYLKETGDLTGPAWGWLFGFALALLSAVLVPETHPGFRRHGRLERASPRGLRGQIVSGSSSG